MSRYQIGGRIYDTAKAKRDWPNASRFDGSNMVSCATGSQWVSETLFLSPRGQFWVEIRSQWQGVSDKAKLVSETEACLWLSENNWKIPEDMTTLLNSLEG